MIFHLSLKQRQIYLWAEVSQEIFYLQKSGKTNQKFPYSLGEKGWKDLFSQLFPGETPSFLPLSLPEFYRQKYSLSTRKSWYVVSIPLSAEKSWSFLQKKLFSTCGEEGVDISFWQKWIPLIQQLFQENRYFPLLVEEKDHWQSVWRCAFDSLLTKKISSQAKDFPREAQTTLSLPIYSISQFIHLQIDYLVRAHGPSFSLSIYKDLFFNQQDYDEWQESLLSLTPQKLSFPKEKWENISRHLSFTHREKHFLARCPFRIFIEVKEILDGWNICLFLQDHEKTLFPLKRAWESIRAKVSPLRVKGFALDEYLSFATFFLASQVPFLAFLREEIISEMSVSSVEIRQFMQKSHYLESEGILLKVPFWWKEGYQEKFVLPEGFQGELRSYQKYGYLWLVSRYESRKGACLADDMGLGKTVQILAFLLRYQKEARIPSLVVCPTSLLHHWKEETRKFTPQLSLLVHHGKDRKKDIYFARHATLYDIVVTSYHILYRDLFLERMEWNILVLDEAQNIKNHETYQAKAARRLKSNYRIAMTGTPVVNKVTEIWSLMEFLNPGFFGHLSQFEEQFAIPIHEEKDEEKKEKLSLLTQPYLLRRTKNDPGIAFDLEEKTEIKISCLMTEEQTRLYRNLVQRNMRHISMTQNLQRKGWIFATLNHLRQICNHPDQFLHQEVPHRIRRNCSGKLIRLSEMLEEIIDLGESCLIFSQFYKMAEMLRRYIEDKFSFSPFFLHGGVPALEREKMVASFQNDLQSPPVFLLTLKAGGVGLNLTRANHVFHFDRWWNSAVENQATDRAHRIGQNKQVFVYKLICHGTIEDKIDQIIEEKKQLIEDLINIETSPLTDWDDLSLENFFYMY